jgi:undecaprenyl-diphosphatase
VPLARQARRHPTSNSLPSGHSASAAAFAVGVGLENAPLGLGLALLAGLVGLSRVATGAHYPGDVFIGFGIGATVAVLGARVVPPVVARNLPATDPLQVEAPLRPDGAGVVMVVNPASGDGAGAQMAEQLREHLPAAEIVELGPDDDLKNALRDAAERAEVLAIAGGDGSVSCAAGIAVDNNLPLAVFPGGTFNHFAKDIGCDTAAKTIQAIKDGSAFRVDLVCFNDDNIVINTASIGAYPDFVQTRERLEHKISKPLASVYAMLHTLRRDEPVRIAYDNKTIQTSLLFIGNSTYLPSGFAPSRRTHLDDGLIDVRILETAKRFSTLRILTSLMLGRLERSPLYHERQVPEFSFRSLDGPTTIATDGEVGSEHETATFSVRYRALAVFRLPPGR